MANLTLRQLRYFDALARHCHFGRAAEACAVSQPALSVQIKEMEETLGVLLFERGAREIRLTAVGRDLTVRVRGILREIDELGDFARASKDDMAGRLRLGIIPTMAPYLLPRMLGELTRLYPQLEFGIRETLTAQLIRELNAGQIDAAIVALPVSEPAFSETVLFEEDFVLVRPASDAGQPVPSPARLREMRLLLLEEGHCFREQALSFCDMRNAEPRELMDGSSLSTLVQMVGAGIGITLIPEMAVPIESRSAQVSVDRFDENTPKRTVGMIWRKTNPLIGQLSKIAQVIRDSTRSEPA